jgi:hypothetical protein
MSVKQAFNLIISTAGRPMDFKRKSSPVEILTGIDAAPDSIYRQIAGPEELTIDATGVVVKYDDFKDTSYGLPAKGHTVTDPVFGTQTINSVKEMFVLGELIGFRIGFK